MSEHEILSELHRSSLTNPGRVVIAIPLEFGDTMLKIHKFVENFVESSRLFDVGHLCFVHLLYFLRLPIKALMTIYRRQ